MGMAFIFLEIYPHRFTCVTKYAYALPCIQNTVNYIRAKPSVAYKIHILWISGFLVLLLARRYQLDFLLQMLLSAMLLIEWTRLFSNCTNALFDKDVPEGHHKILIPVNICKLSVLPLFAIFRKLKERLICIFHDKVTSRKVILEATKRLNTENYYYYSKNGKSFGGNYSVWLSTN